ncbi:MAG: hypothetical protein IJB20_04165, partial [Clostridia bacterium]|nr:hypothetical protein [Clostridia bacterium]
GSGDVELNAEKFYNMIAVDERSMADFNAKSAYSIEIIQNYLKKIAELEEKEQKILLAQLITLESGWGNIEGLELPEPEETEETEAPPEIPGAEETAPQEEEPFDPASRWKTELFEPETPVFDTDYTMNDYDSVADLLKAAAGFEQIIVTYPYTYRPATEETKAYFDADTSAGLELYLSYRLITQTEESSN